MASIGSGAEIFSARNSGYGVTDTAGVVAPGTTTSGFRELAGGGGIFASYDASQMFGLSSNQQLFFSGFFSYDRVSSSFGASPTLAAVGLGGTGSVNANTYRFGGAFLYTSDTAYVGGLGTFSIGGGTESQTFDGSTGRFSTADYAVDLRFGNIFILSNSANAPTHSSMPIKAAPRPLAGNVVALDLSGHVGYVDNWTKGFTDSVGFVYGREEQKYTDIGGRAKLFALYPGNGFKWEPFVAASIDQRLGLSSNLNLPSQTALPSGDVVNFQEANTFWGAELGVNVLPIRNGWTAGVKAYYTASKDTSIVGGNAFVRIPFNSLPTVTRY